MTEKQYERLMEKLDSTEEFGEYNKDHSIEELADIAEVLYALVDLHGYTMDEFEAIRQKKAQERGAFKERLFLVATWKENET